jgi:uroporphyrinogen-III synthase
MVQSLADHFHDRANVIDLAGTSVRLQGRLAVVDGRAEAWLTDRERAILDALTERPGVVLSKRDLHRRVWHGVESDEHVVEVTVARLRRRLGPAAAGIETVVRRGYRATAS